MPMIIDANAIEYPRAMAEHVSKNNVGESR